LQHGYFLLQYFSFNKPPCYLRHFSRLPFVLQYILKISLYLTE
jgi:hypothetical protein